MPHRQANRARETDDEARAIYEWIVDNTFRNPKSATKLMRAYSSHIHHTDGMAALMAVARTMRISNCPESKATSPRHSGEIAQSLTHCKADCAEAPPED